jgi:hypothetical protein
MKSIIIVLITSIFFGGCYTVSHLTEEERVQNIPGDDNNILIDFYDGSKIQIVSGDYHHFYAFGIRDSLEQTTGYWCVNQLESAENLSTCAIKVPFEDVRDVSVRKYSAGKTALFVGSTVAAILLISCLEPFKIRLAPSGGGF